MSDINEKIIEEVRKHSCIYDLQSDLYKNYHYKQDMWVQIAEVVGVTVDDAKKKWKIIRDSYKRYKLRDNQPSGSECAFAKPYKYRESLRFLDDVTSKRKTTCSISEDTTADTLEPEFYSPPSKKKKVEMQERFETFLNAATVSIDSISAKLNVSSTAQLFESLATKIQESGLTKQQVNAIESTVCSIVYSKIAEYTN